ncbi:ABC transporter ATP-binding protein [Nakamurella sp. PAMC28650]|uniref:ABC transporter ATP-binding protein n=1 Tax=Nakamurella sp. PAMC28650 TaxID=2762325 RepID=UPI00164D9B09|nr:oligopeptide/dipeptide ABC transporter ATP-binding protein [Nakamurella sp. PAMC28650]QNK82142.1 ATP-binding cassette domain-containing protein [Nakamurella sp. PAMC28650]
MSTNEDAAPVLLRTAALSKQFAIRRSLGARLRSEAGTSLKAVDGVTLEVRQGQTLGVVGETGSGKSTLGRLMLRLEKPTSGTIAFEGQDIFSASAARSKELRQKIQIILQDPYSTLNPYRSVGSSIEEVLAVHGTSSPKERKQEAERLLGTVGFPAELIDQRPEQLSGGGRQRVSIARALAVKPRLIVADEPVSALDVSVQAQVLNLFSDLRRDLGLTYVFITHDLAVVQRLSDRIAVMYLGRVVEQASTVDLFSRPLHPYSKALLEAAPELHLRKTSRQAALGGDMPNPISPPSGCVFHPRCPQAMDICRREVPLTIRPLAGRTVACHLHRGPLAEPSPPVPPALPSKNVPTTPMSASSSRENKS